MNRWNRLRARHRATPDQRASTSSPAPASAEICNARIASYTACLLAFRPIYRWPCVAKRVSARLKDGGRFESDRRLAVELETGRFWPVSEVIGPTIGPARRLCALATPALTSPIRPEAVSDHRGVEGCQSLRGTPMLPTPHWSMPPWPARIKHQHTLPLGSLGLRFGPQTRAPRDGRQRGLSPCASW